MAASIDVTTEVIRDRSATIVGLNAAAASESIRVAFKIEAPFEPNELAVTEAALLASVALAMQRRCALRLRGKVSRSLRHSIDLYQKTCSGWWPHRYRPIPIEVDVVDDAPPASARGLLCFSGGLDSIYSARHLVPPRQIEAALLVAGYDLDPGGPGQRQQRLRIARLVDRLGLAMLVIDTDVRQVLGQKVIEGAQGSYLAAALTLLSDQFGRGFVSSGVIDLVDLGVSDPVHEATMPLLGSARFPILVYGGQVSRLEKLAEIGAIPELFGDVRVCLERADDGHCKRCPKCLLNAFASVALTGRWPPWYPESAFDASYVAAMRPSETRRRYSQQILKLATDNGIDGSWRAALASHIGGAPCGEPAAAAAGPHRGHNGEGTRSSDSNAPLPKDSTLTFRNSVPPAPG